MIEYRRLRILNETIYNYSCCFDFFCNKGAMKKLLLFLMLLSAHGVSSLPQKAPRALATDANVSNAANQSYSCKPTKLHCVAATCLVCFCVGASYGYCAKEGCTLVACMAHECLSENSKTREDTRASSRTPASFLMSRD